MALSFDRVPDELGEGGLVRVESDAPGNAQAIREIETWCAQHGFMRFQEHHLPVKRREDGTVVRVGRCYRMYSVERQEVA